MKPIRAASFLLLTFLVPGLVSAQQVEITGVQPHVRSSPAYAELLLRTTEVKAELESLIADYTETSPRILDLRIEIDELSKATQRLSAVRAFESGKLTLALGKLLVRKASLETDLARLLRSYKAEHPEVRRAAKKVEIFEAALKELLS